MIVIFYWATRLHKQTTFGTEDEARIPDHTLEQVMLTSLDQSGVPEYQIEAPQMAHFSDDDSIEFDSPVMLVFRRSAPPLRIESEHAWISSDNKEIFLRGKVTIILQELETQACATIKTRDLRVFPQQETAITSQSILAFNTQHQIQGIGGFINYFNGRIKIFREVRGLYDP